MKVARLNFNHREQIVSEPIGFASLTNGCSLEEGPLHSNTSSPMPTFSRTEYVNACFCFDIGARVYTREIRDLFEFLWKITRRQRATPFLPVSLHEGVLAVDCRSVDVWMPVIEFRKTIETLY